MSSTKEQTTRTIVRTRFNNFITKRKDVEDIYGRKKVLSRINVAIHKNVDQNNIEFIMNIIALTDKLLFEQMNPDAEGNVMSKEDFDKNVSVIISYIESKDIFSPENILLEPGYFRIKQEEELIKSGATGVSGMTVCPRCKKDNIIIYSKQKASGDEGETLFNTCTDCNHKWLER